MCEFNIFLKFFSFFPTPVPSASELRYKSFVITGDMEFKQNKYLPAEKQIVTADPDITSVSIALYIICYAVAVSVLFMLN